MMDAVCQSGGVCVMVGVVVRVGCDMQSTTRRGVSAGNGPYLFVRTDKQPAETPVVAARPMIDVVCWFATAGRCWDGGLLDEGGVVARVGCDMQPTTRRGVWAGNGPHFFVRTDKQPAETPVVAARPMIDAGCQSGGICVMVGGVGLYGLRLRASRPVVRGVWQRSGNFSRP